MIEFHIDNIGIGKYTLYCTGLYEIQDFEEGLEATIEKWEIVVQFYEENPTDILLAGGRATCGLCEAARYVQGVRICGDCPVMERTGYSCCYRTPHGGYGRAVQAGASVAAREAAKAELAFLRSL